MRRYLTAAGVHAEIAPDRFTDGGWVLSLDGAEQSHVNLAHPEEIFYEYLRRIGNVVDVVVLDVFTGVDAPAHLTEAFFYEEFPQLLSPGNRASRSG